MPHSTRSPAAPRRRHGGWLPVDEAALAAFRAGIDAHARQRKPGTALTPAVRQLQQIIEDDPGLRMNLTLAIEQARAAGYQLGYADIGQLMERIDVLMTYAPPFDTTALVGCPLNALLDWPMCMPAGFTLFQSPKLNAALKGVLDHWSEFLASPQSRQWLTTVSPKGWFSPEAARHVDMALYACDPGKHHWGFQSWNDFFTRRFKEGARPIAGRGDPAIVVNACESTPYDLQSGVKLSDAFWVKTQPYSLRDIFTPARADLAGHFVGGTVYQAFLSAYCYHRWHAPVGGIVTDAYLVPGTYYADAPSAGLDPAGPNGSQGYITAMATRAIIVIDTSIPGLGKVACVFVGMAEVSSCVIGVAIGDTVEKGDEIGLFQYGGSTHCLIFEPKTDIAFVPNKPFAEGTPPLPLGSRLATVRL
jgi:phosphatidylserine decarboxylase